MNEPYGSLLTDTGPLVALIDPRDAHHKRCRMALTAQQAANATSRTVLITTWSCLTEAAYLLRREGGYPLVQGLWLLWEAGLLRLYVSEDGQTEMARIRDLMNIYQDTPMDLADASIVAAAEVLEMKRVFTLDSHFYAYRMKSGEAFEVIP